MRDRRRLYWRLCCAGTIVLSLLMFTPLVSPDGTAGPFLLGVPRTLWAGILLTVGLVVMTALGTRYHPPEKGEGTVR